MSFDEQIADPRVSVWLSALVTAMLGKPCTCNLTSTSNMENFAVMQTTSSMSFGDDAVVGCLLGTAVGDALGLPYEGMTPRRAAKVLGPPDRYRFFGRRGMVSDDTEHACMVAQSIITSGADPQRFQSALAWKLRWWLLRCPAGIGLATLKGILRLWLAISPSRSGVWSAGNGPAMRSGILGVAIDDVDLLKELVHRSSVLTHTDPAAEQAALAVALASRIASRQETYFADAYRRQIDAHIGQCSGDLSRLLHMAVDSASAQQTTMDFAETLGLSRGVSGYVNHTVPVVIHAWLSYPTNFEAAVASVIRCGGDADTTAAILGGIVGAGVGKQGIPEHLLSRLMEWPSTISWMEGLGNTLVDVIRTQTTRRWHRLPVTALLARNLLFAAVVLAHGFRRLLPPY